MSENSEVVQPIIQYLTMIGAIATRINSGIRFFTDENGEKRIFRGAGKGTSDIICGIPINNQLVYCAIECKRAGNKCTTSQREFLDRVKNGGGLAIVAYSVEDVVNAILDYKRSINQNN